MSRSSRILVAIILLWTLIHAYLLFNFGIVTEGEAEKYITEAKKLIDGGQLTSPNFRMYITQIALLFVSFKLNLGYEFVVALQLICSLIATVSIYRLVSFIFSPETGFIITIWFLLNIPLHQFNVFLQTDSLFYSFTIIFSCYLLRIQNFTLKQLIIVLVSLTLISVTRPTGLLFLPPVVLYLYFRFFHGPGWLYKISFVFLLTALFFYFLNAAIGSGGELDFMLPARTEQIICGVPTVPSSVPIDETVNYNSLYGLFYYVTHNFSQFSRLAFKRAIAFFGVLRSYYSTLHNVCLVLLYYPIYVLAALSARYWFKRPLILLYIASLTFLYLITAVVSCDDWHNRFFLTITPYLMVLAAPVINKLVLRRSF
jgi:hypothetical protein